MRRSEKGVKAFWMIGVMFFLLTSCAPYPYQQQSGVNYQQASYGYPAASVQTANTVPVTEFMSPGFVALHKYLPIESKIELTDPNTRRGVIATVKGRPAESNGNVVMLSSEAARQVGVYQNQHKPMQMRVLQIPDNTIGHHGLGSSGQIMEPHPMMQNSRNTDNDRIQFGEASYYADKFHGKATASGARYDMHAMTCAHRTLPFGTRVKVTNLDNRKAVFLTVTDRGPYNKMERVVDVSYAAAQQLGMILPGVVPVELEVLGK